MFCLPATPILSTLTTSYPEVPLERINTRSFPPMVTRHLSPDNGGYRASTVATTTTTTTHGDAGGGCGAGCDSHGGFCAEHHPMMLGVEASHFHDLGALGPLLAFGGSSNQSGGAQLGGLMLPRQEDDATTAAITRHQHDLHHSHHSHHPQSSSQSPSNNSSRSSSGQCLSGGHRSAATNAAAAVSACDPQWMDDAHSRIKQAALGIVEAQQCFEAHDSHLTRMMERRGAAGNSPQRKNHNESKSRPWQQADRRLQTDGRKDTRSSKSRPLVQVAERTWHDMFFSSPGRRPSTPPAFSVDSPAPRASSSSPSPASRRHRTLTPTRSWSASNLASLTSNLSTNLSSNLSAFGNMVSKNVSP